MNRNSLSVEHFSEKMKKAREEMKMSQKDLAEKVHLTPTTISAYEKKQKFPSLDNAVAIANILDASLDEMCGDSKELSITVSDIMKLENPFSAISYTAARISDALHKFKDGVIEKELCELWIEVEIKKFKSDIGEY